MRFSPWSNGTTSVRKIPKSIAEAAPLYGPANVPDLSPMPSLPADAFVSTALLDDLLPAGERLMRQLFGPQADTATFRSSLSLPMLLGRDHLENHLPKAIAGRRHTLAENLIVPGHSSTRATFVLSGDLHDLQVIAPLRGTGTGRYAKVRGQAVTTPTGDTTSTDVFHLNY